MKVPSFHKTTVNVGLGEAVREPKALDAVVRDISAITGRHPVITQAKKSIAGFRLREGMKIGVMVTLRGERMYEFIDRLFNLGLPRVRDFRVVSESGFDG